MRTPKTMVEPSWSSCVGSQASQRTHFRHSSRSVAVAVSGELHLICVREHMGQATAGAESTRSASISSERTRDGLCGADTPGNGVSPLSQRLISCPGRIESSPGGSRSQAASSSMPTGRSQRRAASAGHRRGDGASAAAAPEGWRDHYGVPRDQRRIEAPERVSRDAGYRRSTSWTIAYRTTAFEEASIPLIH